jgi:DNA-directed RNA polymerase subunit RPC12/RpoP
MQCQVCGQENAAAEKICWKCGAMLSSQQADRADSGTNCPHCGNLNNAASFFCYNCGRYFADVDEAPDSNISSQAETGSLQSPAAPRARLLMPGGSEVQLMGAPTFIERSDLNGKVPQDVLMSISRQHMLITYDSGTFYLQDYGRDGTGSTNHTRLNRVDIHHKGRQALKDGDQIELSRQPEATLIFKWDKPGQAEK